MKRKTERWGLPHPRELLMAHQGFRCCGAPFPPHRLQLHLLFSCACTSSKRAFKHNKVRAECARDARIAQRKRRWSARLTDVENAGACCDAQHNGAHLD